MVVFHGRKSGYAGLMDERVSEIGSRKRVWWRSAAECGGMPWNGKEENSWERVSTINHHGMMVATKKEIL